MKRGFPRPQMHVDRCVTNTITDPKTGVTEWGQGYGEFWDNKTYPVPYTAEEYSISTLHSGRLGECVNFKKCVACGEQVEEETVSVLFKDDRIFSESGPFHEKCARLTERMCPHIAVNSGYVFKRLAWLSVKSQVLACLN